MRGQAPPIIAPQERVISPPDLKIEDRRWSWQKTFAALKYRNYRLWFWGQMISLFGTWMQATAQGYLIFELTRSPAFLGYVGFAGGLPSWLFMLYGGVIADRISRRILLIVTQIMMMFLALVLAALTFLAWIQPWHILILAFFLGVANAFDAPARQAIVSELVPREDLTNAIALNSTMFNSATAVGPAVAGVTYAAFGPAWCFTVNGISFIAVIVALMLIQLQLPPKSAPDNSMLVDLKAGIRQVVTQPMLRTLIIMGAVVSLFGIAYATLLPAWAVKILHGDARTNGLLQSARGIGALLSALLIASLGRFRFKGKLLTLGTFLFPILLLIFTTIHWLPLALIVLVGVGMATILIMNLSNALTQILVPDALRGRVMSIYSLTFFGFMPLGALWIGTMAEHFGEAVSVYVGALASLSCALIIWVAAPKLRELE
ncbi:MFS transporter [candidate division KSB1 bacterium]|nr:MFS transporter [candidate division KSB1 bacterium]